MAQSATRQRRGETARRISRCAQRLTDEHGLDGFTMEDLAAAAEVSRRTLFNYFPGKVDAVLGEWPDLGEEAVALFRAGGPEQDLLADLRTMVRGLLETELAERDVVAVHRRIMLANPRLLGAAHGRYQRLSARIVEHIAAREGAQFGALRARVAVDLLASLFDSSLDEFLRDPHERPFTLHFDEALRTARSLLGA